MKSSNLRGMFDSLRSELAVNARLRAGLVAIAAIVWIYLLMLAVDALAKGHQRVLVLDEQVARLESLAQEREWPLRAVDAQRQLDALRSALWQEPDLGLAEASFQDWLRATASRAGLGLRELNLSRPPVDAGAIEQPIKARLTMDFNRQSLLGFLSELSRSERAIMVDRLYLRTWTQPPSVEIDLRIVVAAPTVAKP